MKIPDIARTRPTTALPRCTKTRRHDGTTARRELVLKMISVVPIVTSCRREARSVPVISEQLEVVAVRFSSLPGPLHPSRAAIDASI
jgi:hypothetical protein